MRGEPEPGGTWDPWSDALAAAALVAVDPAGLGGACLRARAGPAREAWLAEAARLAPDRPVLRLPPTVPDERLYGEIDLAATLAAGRPVRSAGLIAEAAGRTLVLPMAERCAARLAARLGAAMDAAAADGGVGFALVALDEGCEPGEAAPAALVDRLAFRPALDGLGRRDVARRAPHDAADVAAARARLGRVRVAADVEAQLVGLGLALGIGSLRAPILALRAARALAALAGEAEAGTRAATVAARLVLGPRAVRMPELEPEPEEATEPPEAPRPPEAGQAEDDGGKRNDRVPEEMLLEAARAAIPPDLLARLMAGAVARGRRRAGGAGDDQAGLRRGRPAGTRPGQPKAGARVALVDTLRAAAPWQPVRRRTEAAAASGERVLVRAEDFRVRRYKRRAERVAIFVVDASGSTALARLGESKGAIELMLGEAYVGREQVALVAFRGTGAEVLLPPTKSLVMAKRRLAALPGGGGTPLAAGLRAALGLADLCRARGAVPYLAVLTDGKANVDLDGAPGREAAAAAATAVARAIRAAGQQAMVIDTGNRPSEPARALAASMGATYLPLPRADARALSAAMRGAVAGAA